MILLLLYTLSTKSKITVTRDNSLKHKITALKNYLDT